MQYAHDRQMQLATQLPSVESPMSVPEGPRETRERTLKSSYSGERVCTPSSSRGRTSTTSPPRQHKHAASPPPEQTGSPLRSPKHTRIPAQSPEQDDAPARPDRPASQLLSLPAEILSYIVRLIYLESIPRSVHRNLDLHGLPSAYSDGRRISSSHTAVQATLRSLCLVCRGLFAHARPLLYRRIHVTLPYSFILLIRTLGAANLAEAYEQFQLTGSLNQDPHDPKSFPSLLAAAGFARVLGTHLVVTAPSQAASETSSSIAVGDPGGSDDSLSRLQKQAPPRSDSPTAASTHEGRTSATSLTALPQHPHPLTHNDEQELDLVWTSGESMRVDEPKGRPTIDQLP